MFSFVVLLVEELGIAFSCIVASSAANVNFRRTCCHEFAACCYQLPHSFAMNLLHVVLLMQTSIMKQLIYQQLSWLQPSAQGCKFLLLICQVLADGWTDWSSCLSVTCLWRFETDLSMSWLKAEMIWGHFCMFEYCEWAMIIGYVSFLCKSGHICISMHYCNSYEPMTELALNMYQVM